jgi:hypothetical protein
MLGLEFASTMLSDRTLFRGGLFVIIASACAGAPLDQTASEGDEPTPVGVLESALIIPTDSPSVHACSGYTSGGGQRVDGELGTWLSTNALLNDTLNVSVSAANWKRNIGWSRKPTSQLVIDLKVGSQTFEVDTGGETLKEIGDTFQVPSVDWQSGFGFPTERPKISVTFHGRDGSSCSL